MKKTKKIRVMFCPKCRSLQVNYIFTLRNIFGIIPKQKCKKCNYSAMVFPVMEIDKDKLNKFEKRKKGRLKNK